MMRAKILITRDEIQMKGTREYELDKITYNVFIEQVQDLKRNQELF